MTTKNKTSKTFNTPHEFHDLMGDLWTEALHRPELGMYVMEGFGGILIAAIAGREPEDRHLALDAMEECFNLSLETVKEITGVQNLDNPKPRSEAETTSPPQPLGPKGPSAA